MNHITDLILFRRFGKELKIKDDTYRRMQLGFNHL